MVLRLVGVALVVLMLLLDAAQSPGRERPAAPDVALDAQSSGVGGAPAPWASLFDVNGFPFPGGTSMSIEGAPP
jgi:hypothetical protein